MSTSLKSTDVRCKDGVIFSVGPEGCRNSPGAQVVVYAPLRDPAVAASGLAKFETFHEPGDARAEHAGMTIEVVRAYARLHGGVAEAGPEALEFLKRLPSAEVEPAPVPEAPPAVEEAAAHPFVSAPRPEPRWPKPGWVVTSCRLPPSYPH